MYFPWLGTPGFASSEGHRVVPGWTMMDSGDWTRLEMFERTYIRKPPGMPWAIAASASVFGQNEWSARSVSAVSATLAAFLCWLFARSWFGPRAGLAAGAAQALMPLLWLPGGPGRTAEIEMLLLLGTQMAALATIHALAAAEQAHRSNRLHGLSGSNHPVPEGGEGGWVHRLCLATCALLAFLGIVIAALAKGLAAAPVLAGVLGAIIVVSGQRTMLGGSWRGLLHRAAMLLGLAAGTGLVFWIFRINDQPDAVRETGEFLWTDPLGTLTSAPIAFVSAAPVSLAMLWVFGRDARQECAALPPDHPFARGYATARTLALAWLLSAAIYTLVGVSNPRYLLPASVLFAPVVGYVVMGMLRRSGVALNTPSQREGAGGGRQEALVEGEAIEHLSSGISFFTPARRRLARVSLLDIPAPRALSSGRAWVGLLVSGALLSAYLFAHRAEAQKSREIGRAICGMSRALNADAVLADGVIEARPDVLLYTQMASKSSAGQLLIDTPAVMPKVPWWPRLIWDKPGLGSGLDRPLNQEPWSRARLRLSRADVNEHAPYRPEDTHAQWSLGKYRLILHGEVSDVGLPRDESDFFWTPPDAAATPAPFQPH